MTRLGALMCQGMRCGHIDGRSRVGIYVIGEEETIELGPASERFSAPSECAAFANGYRAGYRIGADGSELPDDIKNAPLPEDCK